MEERVARTYDLLRAAAAGSGARSGGIRQLFIDEGEVAEHLLNLDGAVGRLDEQRLESLVRDFGLSPFETDALVACVLAELDPGCGRVYAYLQDDISEREPSIGLLWRLFADEVGRGEERAAFGASAPLLRYRLLRLSGRSDGRLSAMTAAADERIVSHLMGLDDVDRRLSRWVVWDPSPKPRLLTERQYQLVASAAAQEPHALALLGTPRSGRSQAAQLHAHLQDTGLLLVDTPSMLAASGTDPEEAVELAFREAQLLRAALYWGDADGLWLAGDRATACRRLLERTAAGTQVLCLLGVGSRWERPATFAGRPLRVVELPAPSEAERLIAWGGVLTSAGVDVEAIAPAVRAVAAAFRLTISQIANSAAVAMVHAEPGRLPSAADLQASARAVSSRGLLAVSTEVTPKASWEQLVLHQDSVDQLRELCSTVLHHSAVLERGGFGRRLSGGTGITALFAGVSGTGKTMAAEVVAGELGLPLYRIDLAGVVSKWIGETEKNLDRVFEAAANSNAILFFDEADALFGKRSEVKDSHDRYANLEISYLLQKMEVYEGTAILATNMRQQIDDAFLRRLTFTVMFPMPEAD